MSKKILFLSPQLPYPPFSGGVIKSWKLVEFLSAKYELHVAYFLKNEDADYEEEFLGKVALAGYYSEKIDVPRSAINLIKSNLKGMPLNLYRNLSKKFAAKTAEIAHQCDVIFVDHYEVFQYVPSNFKGRVVLHQHNCEYLMWDRFAKVEKNLVKRIALKNQAWWIKNYERSICNQSDVVLAAPNDIEELKLIGGTDTNYLETYHLGDEKLLSAPELEFEKAEEALLFVGTLTWEANVDGLIWFLQEGWAKLKENHPNLKFYIVGKNPDPRIVELATAAGKDIMLTGFVEDLEPYFQKCQVFVSPLRFGSGIKVKVMNAMYRGIPTVTTPVGAEGMAVINKTHLMIEDQMSEFCTSISELINNRDTWQKLSKNSRALAKKKYTWEAVMEIVEEAVEG
ncbi:MAG: glycosyltransferase family 4 protein [Chitinophagales bacterium]